MSTKKKKERTNDGLKQGGGVNYAAVLGHRIDDKRHEREKEYKKKQMVNTSRSYICMLLIFLLGWNSSAIYTAIGKLYI
jgi:RNA polymerase-interacting CarD/CdnL/TRCF family regulator